LTKGDEPLTATEKGDFEANPDYLFQPNLNFSTAVRPTWTPQHKRDFYDAFLYTATAFQRMDRTIANDAKLLLSTCRTELHAYDAFACEAHSWASHSNHWHFGTLLEEIKIFPRDHANQIQQSEGNEAIPTLSHLPPDFSGEITKHGIDALVWSSIYINEAFKKKAIFFNRFTQLAGALRRSFYAQGREARHYWDCMIEEPAIIDSSRDKELDQAFDNLAKLVSMEARLTSYVVLLLLHSGILSIDALTNALKQRGMEDLNAWLLKDRRLSVLAAKYNAHFGYLRSRGLTSLLTRIPEQSLELGDYTIVQESLAIIRKCYRELRAAVEKECPEEKSPLEGEYFRYARRFEKAPRPELFQPALLQI
jgi:hypothetical protein